MKVTILLLSSILSISAFANYSLSQNKQKVVCYGEDNQSFTLNAKRTTLQFIVEGESQGPEKIIKTISDNKTYTSYRTVEGILVLSNSGNTFQFNDDQVASVVDCH